MRGLEPVCDCVELFPTQGELLPNFREVAGRQIGIKVPNQGDALDARGVPLLDFMAGDISCAANSKDYKIGPVI